MLSLFGLLDDLFANLTLGGVPDASDGVGPDLVTRYQLFTVGALDVVLALLVGSSVQALIVFKAYAPALIGYELLLSA